MIDLILTGLAAVVIVGLVWRFTVSPQAMRANRSRALRWRIKFRLPLGRGYATMAELGSGGASWPRWSRAGGPGLTCRGGPG